MHRSDLVESIGQPHEILKWKPPNPARIIHFFQLDALRLAPGLPNRKNRIL
jgi:hypothetical protein